MVEKIYIELLINSDAGKVEKYHLRNYHNNQHFNEMYHNKQHLNITEFVVVRNPANKCTFVLH